MEKTLSVSEYNDLVSNTVKNSNLLNDVFVTGEITDLKPPNASGHVYFTLKDAKGTLSCTLFRGSRSKVKIELKNGLKVTVFGVASYYGPYGKFSFNVLGANEYGKGELQEALEELTKKLMAEGLFEPERKRKIPKYPKVIGVATSATGAVIKDIIDTTSLRYPVDILLAPTVVQGKDAEASIINSIRQLNECNVDVIIVGRGGGSADDLSAFNIESVVRAVAESRIPIISAVGHATDKSLTDRVADAYAVTPTAAAELATPDKHDELRNISNLTNRMRNSVTNVKNRMESKFNLLDGKLSTDIFKSKVEIYRTKFASVTARIISYADRTKIDFDQNVAVYETLCDTADDAIKSVFETKKHMLQLSGKTLDTLDPKSVLGRGYSFVTDSDGKVVTSVDGISIDADITVRMKDGSVKAKVNGVKKND